MAIETFDTIIDEDTVDEHDGLEIRYTILRWDGASTFFLPDDLPEAIVQAQAVPDGSGAVERHIFPVDDPYDIVECSVAWAGPESPWLPYVGLGSFHSFSAVLDDGDRS